MPTLLIVGAGMFGSLAAACARSHGIEAKVFDPGLPGRHVLVQQVEAGDADMGVAITDFAGDLGGG